MSTNNDLVMATLLSDYIFTPGKETGLKLGETVFIPRLNGVFRMDGEDVSNQEDWCSLCRVHKEIECSSIYIHSEAACLDICCRLTEVGGK